MSGDLLNGQSGPMPPEPLESWPAALLLQEYHLTLSLDVVAVSDFSGTVRQVNAVFHRTLGWVPEEVIGKPWQEFIHPDDLPTAEAAFVQVISGAVQHHVSVRCLCRDGSSRWIEWNSQPLLAEQLVISTGRDVTYSRRQALLLERTSAAARIGGWEVDCISGELYWTYQTYCIHETSPAEYTPRVDTAIAFYVPESRPIITEAVRRGIETGEPWDLELELITARRRRIVVRAIGEAERQHGRTTKLFGSFQDITEQKQAREEKARLEARVQQAQKLDSLGVLAGGVAHDFNNLLTGILGHADLALMHLPPASPARAHLEQVVTGAARAADLTKQLLAYSGKGKFVVQRLDLSEMLREMGSLLQVSVSRKVALKYHLAENLPAIEGDATQLRQVAMNLILNAAEALGDHIGFIVVSTGVMHCTRESFQGCFPDEDRPEGDYVFLSVADTGCGMTSEVRGRIFDPFYSTKFAGRGLGLAAVLGIVRGHRGAILVQSEPGRGTTFKVLFPALSRPALPAEAAPEPVADWQGSGTVLVVDDEEAVRGMARAMLRRMGLTVLTANDGRDGVETFRRHADEVRLVLLDLTMPHLDGEGAFHEMKAMRPDVPVLLSSGFSQPEGVHRLAGQGLAGFIQKPYRYEQLVQAVRQALDAADPKRG